MIKIHRTELNRAERQDQVRIGPITDVFTGKPFGEAVPTPALPPAWKAGPDGVPPDRDVWAYAYDRDSREDIGLLRGRYDHVFDEFRETGSDRLLTTKILCWVDGEERPSFSVAAATAFIASLKPLADNCHDEIAHMAEDWLHREALRAVVAGYPDAREIAAAALESRTVKFTRYYS